MAITWNLRELRYYEDGRRRATQTLRGPVPLDTVRLFYVVLAGWSGDEHAIVTLDEFYMFPCALTDALVLQEYKRLRPGDGEAR